MTSRWSRSLRVFYVQVTWPQPSAFHKYPAANTHMHTSVQMTIVAHSYRQRGLNGNQTCCGPFRAQRRFSSGSQKLCGTTASPITTLTHPSREGCVEGWKTLSQIHAFYWLGLWTPTGPRLMEIQTASWTHWHTQCTTERLALMGGLSPSQPRSHPILMPLHWVGWGDWGQTSWAHPLVLYASRNPVLLLLLFCIHVIGWSGDVLILDSYQESPGEFSSATHP